MCWWGEGNLEIIDYSVKRDLYGWEPNLVITGVYNEVKGEGKKEVKLQSERKPEFHRIDNQR